MKSIGGRRRRIVANYLATSALLGLAGTVVGTAIGLPMTNLLTNYLGRFQGVHPGWRVSWLALGLSVAVGIGGTLLASLPPLLRGTRVTVREALGQPGSDGSFGSSIVDRLRRPALGGCRGPPSSGCGRRRGARPAASPRSCRSRSRSERCSGSRRWRSRSSRSASRVDWPRGATSSSTASATGDGSTVPPPIWSPDIDGVDRMQPIVGADVLVGDTDTFAWGLPADPVFDYELSDGRWFTAEENDATPVRRRRRAGARHPLRPRGRRHDSGRDARRIGRPGDRRDRHHAGRRRPGPLHPDRRGPVAQPSARIRPGSGSPRPHATPATSTGSRPRSGTRSTNAGTATGSTFGTWSGRPTGAEDRTDHHDHLLAGHPDRGDGHDRAGVGDDDEHHRTDPRDRHPAQPRRPRPRHPPRLPRRSRRARGARMADRHRGRLRRRSHHPAEP